MLSLHDDPVVQKISDALAWQEWFCPSGDNPDAPDPTIPTTIGLLVATAAIVDRHDIRPAAVRGHDSVIRAVERCIGWGGKYGDWCEVVARYCAEGEVWTGPMAALLRWARREEGA